MNANIKVLSFAKEIAKYIFNPTEKIIRWGSDNMMPNKIIELYESIPEHSASIDFISEMIVDNGLEQLDYWTFKKITIDYLLFGGFTVQVIKKRNGTYSLEYIDISKCRLNPDEKFISYSEDWDRTKAEIISYPITTSISKEGIFFFKSYRSRGKYPSPYYLSAFKSLDTLDAILSFHHNSANNGFSPNVLINFNNGTPDLETQDDIEKAIKDKFSGASGQRFILAFNEGKDNAVTIEKLQADNLDEKFETLQKFLQNEIMIAHRITSGCLIGVKPENQGFSKTEYSEALEIFKDTTVSGLRKELLYALSSLLEIDLDVTVEPNKIEEV